MNTDPITLTRHLISLQQTHPEASGDFTLLINAVTMACKFIASKVSHAGIIVIINISTISLLDQLKLELKLSKKSNQAFLDLAGDNFSQLCRCIRQDRKFLKRPKTIFIVLWNALSYLGNKMRPVYHTCRPIITQLYYLGLSYHLTLGVS